MSATPAIDATRIRPGAAIPADRPLARIPPFVKWPTAAPLLLGVVLVTAIGVLDGLTGRTLSVEFMYMGTVVIVAWVGSRRSAVLVAALAVSESLFADLIGTWDLTTTMVVNTGTRLAVLVFVVAIISSLRVTLLQQRHLAMIDPLTGALNRRAFTIAADRERLRAARDGQPITVAYMDLDGFKGVNDRHGHKAGDRLLRQFAETVSKGIRGTDLFARIGGDEFVVVFPNTGTRDAIGVMRRVVQVVGEECCLDQERVTASVGIMTFQYPPATVDMMIAEADRMMYQAKALGHGQMVGAVAAGPWLRWATESLRPDINLLQVEADDVVVELFR